MSPACPADLPDNVDELKRMIVAQGTELQAQTLHIEKLKAQLARYNQLRLGVRSETLDQLELGIEDSETELGIYTSPLGLPA